MKGFSIPGSDVILSHIPVQKASEHSRYSQQYLRRILRQGRIEGLKVGAVWLIQIGSLESQLSLANSCRDRHFGPRGVCGDLGVL